jgi:NDP-sugar pyrophosphorylase family protein
MSSPAAFVLAAGLGTRLAPLTDILPKPLVPVFHKPLLTFALDSLLSAGVGTLALNTHHLPGAFKEAFGKEPSYRDRPLHLFHEPLLLDTGGGIRNARTALGDSTFVLYNGDILADLPIAELLAAHRASGSLATMLLRPAGGGGVANVRFDPNSGRVLDLRGVLGVADGDLAVYSGVAVFEPAIMEWIPESGPYSIIDALLSALRAGEKVGGMIATEGLWIDLGTPDSYLRAHRLLADPTTRPGYVCDSSWPSPVHPDARIASGALLEGVVAVGSGAVVESGAVVRDSVIWPGSVIRSDARIEGCVVSGVKPVSGTHEGGVI